ncbi:MAG: hypothetical protein Q7Q73_06245 [Verrucomicrobiota bacterium JB024]|nr:hypothetical protein [Verrucomicrobiota bacterium JB024]
MSVSEERSLITFEDFLARTMGSEIEAGFVEFLSIWRTSEGLQLLIRQFVEHAGGKSASRVGGGTVSSPEERSLAHERNAVFITEVEERLSQSYGGLTRKELLILLERYKAGNRDLGVYLLVRAWKKSMAGADAFHDPRLRQLTLDYLGRAIAENRTDFFQQIKDTLTFFQKEEFHANGQWNHDPGQWWQFHLLLYVLEHPKEKYPMREFVRYFEAEVGATAMPTLKTLRHFCRSVGITLDSSPGAPRKTERKGKK